MVGGGTRGKAKENPPRGLSLTALPPGGEETRLPRSRPRDDGAGARQVAMLPLLTAARGRSDRFPALFFPAAARCGVCGCGGGDPTAAAATLVPTRRG